MRQIKFRAWSFTDKKWYTRVHVGTNCCHAIYDEDRGEWLDFDELCGTVVQFTGLQDRNGKDIYEGDVVLIYGEQELDYGFSFEWNEHAVVCWNDDECGFYLDAIKKREVSMDEDAIFTVDSFPLRKWTEGEWGIEYEVIGSIHSNPELLEATV